jgi:lipopolysaccharide/colanic/teichoic acid biosynthesis glycosyltransferase
VHSRETLLALIEHERGRTERTGREISLVFFSAAVEKGQVATVQLLSSLVVARIRATDEVGCWQEDCVAVLLPETGIEGARRFVHDIRGKLVNGSEFSAFHIYTYPSNWIDGNDESGLKRLIGAGHNGNGHNGSGHNGNGRNGNGHNGNGHNGNGHNGNGHAGNGHNGNGHSGNGHNGNGHNANGHTVSAQNANGHGENGQANGPDPMLQLRHVQDAKHWAVMFTHPLPLWKRAVDITAALIGIVLSAPAMLIIALAVKLTSRGPIIFRQQRAGRGGVPFVMYKFRTMINGAERKLPGLKRLSEQDGPAFKLKRDPRITSVGRLLRNTSLDELPQLWNVLKGDMSLVGPRPLPCHEAAACEPWQRRRLDVTPGITCIWQVHGRSRVSFSEWMRMDLAYIRRRTLMHDLKILLLTLPAVVKGRGAH